MAEIVFGAALSHSPMMNFPLKKDQAKVDRFKAAVGGIARQLQAAAPDVILIFGPDHFRTLFYDLMPSFVIGIGSIEGWGDWDTPRGPFTPHPLLAEHLLRTTLEDGFEPAFSREIKVDHGVTQPLELLGLTAMAVIPVVINAAGPPLPTPLRCHAFGSAVGSAIRSYPQDLRVAVLASGGLSHDPPAPAGENMLHGRTNGFAGSREREAQLIARADILQLRINPQWDRRVLAHFEQGTVSVLASELNTESVFEEAGNGGQEVRTWIALAGTLGDAKMKLAYYEPIDELITGMGVIST